MTQEKFKKMVIELHSYYDSNITNIKESNKNENRRSNKRVKPRETNIK